MLEIRRRVFLPISVYEHVPSTLVGQPASLLECSECRFARGGNWPVLTPSRDDKDHKFLRSCRDGLSMKMIVKWLGLSEQRFRLAKWSVCRG
jgi:hypothetical protein